MPTMRDPSRYLRDRDFDPETGSTVEREVWLRHRRHGRVYSLVIGALLATFGVILLATNLGWIDMRAAMRQFWPFALVVVGIAKLVGDNQGRRSFGLIPIFVGLWIYAAQRDWIHVQFWAVFGPAVLIFLGAMVTWRAFAKPPRRPLAAAADGPGDAGYVSSFSVMSGSEHKPTQPFQGANLGAVMGGVKLDLAGAEMQGDTAIIEVFAVWGGIEIFAPRDWDVASKVVTFMGGSADKRRPAAVLPRDMPRKTLVIQGFVLMGGIEIKD
jgi:predicted membrane protein